MEKGFYKTRQQAQRGIMAGLVQADGERADKPGTRYSTDVSLAVTGQEHPYVSRGGLKLEEAIRVFELDLQGKIVLDIGASTGGFTDCALMHGAQQVVAIDVGYGQLAWKLRQDARVIVKERTNFRHMTPADLAGIKPNFATIDVSFISLSRILPPLRKLLIEDAVVVPLIKPQFEAGREQVGKKGIVRDPFVHRLVLHNFVSLAEKEGYRVEGLAPSPIRGGEGNIEFIAYLRWAGMTPERNWMQRIDQMVDAVHQK